MKEKSVKEPRKKVRKLQRISEVLAGLRCSETLSGKGVLPSSFSHRPLHFVLGRGAFICELQRCQAAPLEREF